jgi:hypothetical protein
MNQKIVVRDVVGPVPYWAADEDLPKVRARFKRLSGKFPSSKASIIAFTGDLDDLDNISINDLGDISYSKKLAKVVIQ